MSSIASVGGGQPHIPQVKPNTSAPPQQPPAAVQPASKDADGDNDGSKGSKIDVKV